MQLKKYAKSNQGITILESVVGAAILIVAAVAFQKILLMDQKEVITNIKRLKSNRQLNLLKDSIINSADCKHIDWNNNTSSLPVFVDTAFNIPIPGNPHAAPKVIASYTELRKKVGSSEISLVKLGQNGDYNISAIDLLQVTGTSPSVSQPAPAGRYHTMMRIRLTYDHPVTNKTETNWMPITFVTDQTGAFLNCFNRFSAEEICHEFQVPLSTTGESVCNI